MRDNLFLVAVEVDAVGGLDFAVERFMRVEQVSGHLVGVVEIGEGGTGMRVARVEDALSAPLDGCALLGSRAGSDKVVVDDGVGIAIVAFEPARNCAHPGIVEFAGHNTKIVKRTVRHVI